MLRRIVPPKFGCSSQSWSRAIFPTLKLLQKFSFLLLLGSAAHAATPELVISTYDTLIAPGGFASALIPKFEKQCGCKVRVVSSGDAGQILTRLQLDAERKQNTVDVLLGLDSFLWARAQGEIESWGAWKPAALKKIRPEVLKRIPANLVPFDFGYLAFMADTQALAKMKLPAPQSLSELVDARWKRNLILEDPRTSTPGLIFLLYTPQALWKKLSSQWLTLTAGWDQAYGLFLSGEAPLVWSYTTSEAYHQEHGGNGRYRALLFKEGQPLQIEAAAIARGAQHPELAKQFLEFLLTPDVQMTVAHTNWMYPVLQNIPLPPSFQALPKPEKIVSLPFDPAEVKSSLKQWSETVTGLTPAK